MHWWIYYGLQVLQYASLIATTAVAALQKADKVHFGSLSWIVAWLQEWGWLLLVVFPIVATISKAICQSIGPPWVWQSVQRVLKKLRDDAFVNVQGTDLHRHRVTLFRYRRWCVWESVRRLFAHGMFLPPWAGWMVPVARVPDHVKNSTTVFLIGSDPDNAEGIVGKVWKTRNVEIQSLPELRGQSESEEIDRYAREALVAPAWIRRRLRKGRAISRSIGAFHVEVKDKLYGVVVIDSRDPDTIKPNKQWHQRVQVTAEFLTELLGRA